MSEFRAKTGTSSRGLRTPRDIQADPRVGGTDYVVVPDAQVRNYEAQGFIVEEDLVGEMTLMKHAPKARGSKEKR